MPRLKSLKVTVLKNKGIELIVAKVEAHLAISIHSGKCKGTAALRHALSALGTREEGSGVLKHPRGAGKRGIMGARAPLSREKGGELWVLEHPNSRSWE